jgi:hypothetical protein
MQQTVAYLETGGHIDGHKKIDDLFWEANICLFLLPLSSIFSAHTHPSRGGQPPFHLFSSPSKSQICSRPGNAHYLSPESQNQLIDAIGDEVLHCIVQKAREANYFAVMMDETTDLAHLEQIAVVVRFCDDDFNAYERLLSITESPTVTGEHLAEILVNTIQRHNLDTRKLIAQTYDGAASMSGCNRGVQAVIRQVSPQAHFNHCHSHSCNLVIVKSVHSSVFGRTYFGVLEQRDRGWDYIEGMEGRNEKERKMDGKKRRRGKGREGREDSEGLCPPKLKFWRRHWLYI